VPLPNPIDAFSTVLVAAAGRYALFSIGLFLYEKPVRKGVGEEGVGEVSVMLAIKLLAHPLLAWLALVVLLDVESLWAQVDILLAGLPAGATGFILACQYGVFVQRTSTAILILTIAAVITISVLFTLIGAGQT